VTRLLGAIVYNWPLKLAAIALATLLYVGLIVSENAQSRDVDIHIEATNRPPDTIQLGDLGAVSNIRYFIADQANVAITSANFTATVDLSQVQPGPQAQSLRVIVTSADPRIQVTSSTPEFVSIRLEKVTPKTVPINVVPGPVPDGLAIEPPKPSLTSATVRGAASDINRVAAVRATVSITSGLDIDADFALTAVDALGDPVRNVEVEPQTVHVTMSVFKDRRTASVPILPRIVGNLASGFEVAEVTPSVPVVGVEGDATDLANVTNATTQPISLDGRSADFDITVGFDLPEGVTAVTPQTVTVHVTVRAVSQTRNFSAGIVMTGQRADRTYALSLQDATITIGGAPADLDRLSGSTLVLTVDVSDLDPGAHTVTLTLTLQGALNVVAISPATVTVTVAPIPGASPAASASASGG
jgi:YbbR domain-containing protein